jgi:hypothetical protein
MIEEIVSVRRNILRRRDRLRPYVWFLAAVLVLALYWLCFMRALYVQSLPRLELQIEISCLGSPLYRTDSGTPWPVRIACDGATWLMYVSMAAVLVSIPLLVWLGMVYGSLRRKLDSMDRL